MLIGIDANEANLTRNRVGVNEYAFNLLHALYQLDTVTDFVIYLKTPPLADLPPARGNWHYRVIPFPKFWTQTRLPFDLFFHRPQPQVFFSATHYAPRWSPIPTVVAIMDLGFLLMPNQFTSKDYNQLKSWTGYSVRQAAKVVAISEYTRQQILKFYHKPSRDVVAIPLSYNAQLFTPTKDKKILDLYHINSPYLIFVSSLKPSKNVTGLLNAFSKFSAQHPEYSLVIVGKKAWLYQEIFDLVLKLGLKDRVVFTGFVPEPHKPALISQAEAFVMPSFYEGFSITLLESMACGTPVVASNVTSQPEVAGDAGIYVDPNSPDSILAGLEQATGPLRHRFVKMGLARVKLFSWQQTAESTLKVIESAAKNHVQ